MNKFLILFFLSMSALASENRTSRTCKNLREITGGIGILSLWTGCINLAPIPCMNVCCPECGATCCLAAGTCICLGSVCLVASATLSAIQDDRPFISNQPREQDSDK